MAELTQEQRAVLNALAVSIEYGPEVAALLAVHADLEARLAAAERALRELVACKDLHDEAERYIAGCMPGGFAMLDKYRARKIPSWAAARAAIASGTRAP